MESFRHEKLKGVSFIKVTPRNKCFILSGQVPIQTLLHTPNPNIHTHTHSLFLHTPNPNTHTHTHTVFCPLAQLRTVAFASWNGGLFYHFSRGNLQNRNALIGFYSEHKIREVIIKAYNSVHFYTFNMNIFDALLV